MSILALTRAATTTVCSTSKGRNPLGELVGIYSWQLVGNPGTRVANPGWQLVSN